MDELTFKDISTNMRQVFESDNIMKMIFDILEKESRLNLALCCKKFYSYFKKKNQNSQNFNSYTSYKLFKRY